MESGRLAGAVQAVAVIALTGGHVVLENRQAVAQPRIVKCVRRAAEYAGQKKAVLATARSAAAGKLADVMRFEPACAGPGKDLSTIDDSHIETQSVASHQ